MYRNPTAIGRTGEVKTGDSDFDLTTSLRLHSFRLTKDIQQNRKKVGRKKKRKKIMIIRKQRIWPKKKKKKRKQREAIRKGYRFPRTSWTLTRGSMWLPCGTRPVVHGIIETYVAPPEKACFLPLNFFYFFIFSFLIIKNFILPHFISSVSDISTPSFQAKNKTPSFLLILLFVFVF